MNQEIKHIKLNLNKYLKKIEDKAIAIKLVEIKDLIQPLSKNLSVQDENVANLLNYYELINELKTIHD